MSKQIQEHNSLELGVYLHIPFCSSICHYCDFAKTAHWDDELKNRYLNTLNTHLKSWLHYLKQEAGQVSIITVNIGGGTPSLITHGYEGIFSSLAPYLSPDCEVSLEANPNDCSLENLKIWKNCGFNRISVGVQTFQEKGLSFLKRDHSRSKAIKSMEACGAYFENTNLDLIYSWPSQSLGEWLEDLELAQKLNCKHFSLYNLTYAQGTPIGRARQRGKIIEPRDESQEQLYYSAMEYLAKYGFEHEEVSNWSKKGFSCKHNWLYWQGKPYLGVGAGAHGFLPGKSPIGVRYHYTRRERSFRQVDASTGNPFEDFAPLIEIEQRDEEAYLLELLGSSLRSSRGLDLQDIKTRTGKSFCPNAELELAMENKLLTLDKDRLYLHPKEWFREVHWCLKLSECFEYES
ncbi:MAG: radical SAM family heme chaperone HemW [Oligoflexales bacterium]|nr:radical SAM family heme chaperone HemW [Oligoflexales bacterium]